MSYRNACICTVTLASMLTFASCKTGPQPATKYGSNSAVGQTFTHDGVKLYYEVYGKGEPLLVIHGNNAGIFSLSAQIDYFRKRYKVIAMDSRDQGGLATAWVRLPTRRWRMTSQRC
jgi:hypothetical protein